MVKYNTELKFKTVSLSKNNIVWVFTLQTVVWSTVSKQMLELLCVFLFLMHLLSREVLVAPV